MPQVLAAPQRRPSFSERLGAGVGKGLEGAQQLYQQHQFEKSNPQLSGLPPELQKIALAEQLKGQSRENILRQKHDMFSNIFGGQGKKQQNQTFSPDEQNAMGSMGNESQQFDPSQISDQDIIELSTIDPQMAMAAQRAKNESLKQKRHDEDIDLRKNEIRRKEETEISKPILLEMNQVRKNIPLQEQAIEDIISASPNVSALDYFADVTGFEPLRSAEGAKLKTGIKDFFLSDLTRTGSRPNMWIEQQLADALPKIGRSKEANLITAEGLRFKTDLAKHRMETIDRLAEKDREKYGYVKADIDSRAYKDMKKYVIDRQKQLSENIKKIKSQNKGKKDVFKMTSPDGSVYEISSDDVDEALKHDFKLAS